MPEEAGYSQYEMTSVSMSQLGHLTPTRQGKLPDAGTPPPGYKLSIHVKPMKKPENESIVEEIVVDKDSTKREKDKTKMFSKNISSKGSRKSSKMSRDKESVDTHTGTGKSDQKKNSFGGKIKGKAKVPLGAPGSRYAELLKLPKIKKYKKDAAKVIPKQKIIFVSPRPMKKETEEKVYQHDSNVPLDLSKSRPSAEPISSKHVLDDLKEQRLVIAEPELKVKKSAEEMKARHISIKNSIEAVIKQSVDEINRVEQAKEMAKEDRVPLTQTNKENEEIESGVKKEKFENINKMKSSMDSVDACINAVIQQSSESEDQRIRDDDESSATNTDSQITVTSSPTLSVKEKKLKAVKGKIKEENIVKEKLKEKLNRKANVAEVVAIETTPVEVVVRTEPTTADSIKLTIFDFPESPVIAPEPGSPTSTASSSQKTIPAEEEQPSVKPFKLELGKEKKNKEKSKVSSRSSIIQ